MAMRQGRAVGLAPYDKDVAAQVDEGRIDAVFLQDRRSPVGGVTLGNRAEVKLGLGIRQADP